MALCSICHADPTVHRSSQNLLRKNKSFINNSSFYWAHMSSQLPGFIHGGGNTPHFLNAVLTVFVSFKGETKDEVQELSSQYIIQRHQYCVELNIYCNTILRSRLWSSLKISDTLQNEINKNSYVRGMLNRSCLIPLCFISVRCNLLNINDSSKLCIIYYVL